MWRIPLKVQVTDLNRHPLILDSPNGTESKNPLYVAPTCARIPKHIDILKKNRPAPSKANNNVYELPSIEPAIRYLHDAAGLPTKATWLKEIRNESYIACPLVNIKNVSKHFPESEETQKGHMHTQRQGVRFTKTRQSTRAFTPEGATPVQTPIPKKKEIFI